jgi:hypothetical protein
LKGKKGKRGIKEAYGNFGTILEELIIILTVQGLENFKAVESSIQRNNNRKLPKVCLCRVTQISRYGKSKVSNKI